MCVCECLCVQRTYVCMHVHIHVSEKCTSACASIRIATCISINLYTVDRDIFAIKIFHLYKFHVV